MLALKQFPVFSRPFNSWLDVRKRRITWNIDKYNKGLYNPYKNSTKGQSTVSTQMSVLIQKCI